jgi:hypothetical protein
LTQCSQVCEALHVLGLLADPAVPFRLIAGNWVRGGAETYFSKFEVLPHGQPGLTILIKACVTFTPGVDLDSVIGEWVRRRRLLSENGIKTPRLYCAGFGVLIEEYVPYELRNLLSYSRRRPAKLLADLVTYCETLCRLGFTPIDPFRDLRSHGSDLVVVDFGADLGPPGVVPTPQSILFKKLQQYLSVQGIKLEPSEYDRLYGLFAAQDLTFI